MSCADTGYYLCRRFQQRSPVIIVERRNIKPTSSEGKKRSIAHHQKLPKSSASYIQFPQGKKKLPLPPNLILKVTTVEPPARRPPDLGSGGHHEHTCEITQIVSKIKSLTRRYAKNSSQKPQDKTHPQTSPSRNSAQSRSCMCCAARLVGFGQAYKLGRGSIGFPSWLDCQLRARSRCVGWELGLGRSWHRRAGSGAGRSRLGSLRW